MLSRNEACPRMLQYRPPRIAMTLLLFATALQLLAPRAWPVLPSSVVGGALFALLGFSVMLRAWWLFREQQTAICPTAKTTTLIRSDVYRLTRNPMYLGMVLMLLGLAIATGGVFYYVVSLAFFLIIDFVFCPYEETKLAGVFGNEFAHYVREVRRWL